MRYTSRLEGKVKFVGEFASAVEAGSPVLVPEVNQDVCPFSGRELKVCEHCGNNNQDELETYYEDHDAVFITHCLGLCGSGVTHSDVEREEVQKQDQKTELDQLQFVIDRQTSILNDDCPF